MEAEGRPIAAWELKPDSALCLEIARSLARRDGLGDVESFDCPDLPNATVGAPQGQKFIDLIASTSGGVGLALEHTVVESYQDQLHEGRQLTKLLVPLEASLAGRLPHDRSYQLSVGKGAVNDKTLDPDDVQQRVGSWVCDVAPTLPAGSPAVAPNHVVEGGPPALPFDVRLSAWPGTSMPGGGRLSVWRGIAESSEEQAAARAKRFARALNDKLPKLLAHVRARTLLVLEDRDISTSNVWLAAEAAKSAASGRDLPDTIVLVEMYNDVACATVVYDRGMWMTDYAAALLPVEWPLPIGDAEAPGAGTAESGRSS